MITACTYIRVCDVAGEGLVARAESLVDVKEGTCRQLVFYFLNCLLYLNHQLPDLTIVLKCLVAERGATGRVAVLEALTAELASVVLVYGHKRTRKLTVLEQAVDFAIQAKEELVAVFLSGWNVKLAKSYVHLLRVHVPLPVVVDYPVGVDQVKVFS